MKRIIFKIAGWIIGGLLGLFLLAWILIQIPSIQNAIVDSVTKTLSQSLQTEVKIDRVNIRFFKTLVLKGFYVEDQAQDTLLFVQDLGVNIGIFNLLRNRIHLQRVSVRGMRANLHRPAQDSVYNYQFILNALTRKEPDTTTTGSDWTFGVDEISINDTRFRMRDEFGRTDLDVNLQHFNLRINQLDLAAQLLDIQSLQFRDSRVAYTILPNLNQSEILDTTLVSQQTNVTFPNIGWALKANKLRLAKNIFIYENLNTEPAPDVIDYDHLALRELSIDLDNMHWDTATIQGNIKNIAFQERSGFQLDQLAANLRMTNQQITAENFHLKTPQTDFVASANLNYQNFKTLVSDFIDAVQLDIDIKNSYVAYEDLAFFAPAIKEIKQLNTALDKRIRLSASATGTVNDLKNVVANLSIGNDLQFRATGSARQLTDPEQLTFRLNLQQLSTAYDKMKRLTRNINLPPGLDTLGQFDLSGQFRGSLDTIYGQNVVLHTERYTGFQGDIVAVEVTNPDLLSFDLRIRELKTQAVDISGFAQMPPQVVALGKIRYVGNLSGTLTTFNLSGDLQTDAGNAKTNISLDFNKQYSNASYDGNLSLDQFDLGTVLSDTTIGKVSLTLQGSGSGLSLDSLNAKIAGAISTLEYRNYAYNDLQLDGQFRQKQFTGEASIQDQNLAFDFQGDINLNDSLPVFQFTANIDTVNIKQLNLSPTFYGFSGKITANMTGLRLDDLKGTAHIRNLAISNDTASYQTNLIELEAKLPNTRERNLSLRSAFLTAHMDGDYNLAELPNLIKNFVNDYFPIDQLINPKDTPPKLSLEPQSSGQVPDQAFDLLVQFDQPVPLLKLFVPGLEQLDTAFFAMQMDSRARNLQLRSRIPKVVYQGRAFDNIQLDGQGTPEALKTSLTLEEIDYGGMSSLPIANVNVTLSNDSLFLSLEAKEKLANDKLQNKLALAGNAFKRDSLYYFVFEPDFILNGENWSIPPENEISYKYNLLAINNFELNKNSQRISINSTDEPQDDDFSPILVEFSNFNLQEVSRLVRFSADKYAGKVNGQIKLRQPRTNLNYLVDMTIDSIKLNEAPIGNLMVKAEQDRQRPVISIDAALTGGESNAEVSGTYALSTSEFDLDASIRALQLRLLDPFMAGTIEDSRGTLAGNFKIKGNTETPKINGTLDLSEVSTILGITGVRYTIRKEEISIDNQVIDLGELRLLDEDNNEAMLSGTLHYADLSDIGLDLNFSTRQFPVLHTSSSGESLYYGKLLVAAEVSIAGTVNSPRIDAQATTLPTSQLFVQPMTTQEAVATQEDYIIFGNPATFTPADTSQTLDAVYRINRRGIDLALNLEVTSGTELQILIDPATGDKLICRGDADLTVNMNPAGEVDINGSYRITNGSYSFNYQGLVKRQFGIQSGSRLDFIGDPLDTRFDVTATYTTRTPTYELIRNQVTALTAEQEKQAKTRSPVTVVLNMRGDLESPIISFDIRTGAQEASPVTSVEAQALARLRDNPSELNKQVFSLLLFNSFLAESSGGGSLAEAGTSVYLSSVSSLITNQLNRLADRYIKGFEVDIGVESYQRQYELSEDGNTITELQLGVSKQLFNDRLTVRVGGNVNVTSENSLLVEGANFSSIAGDFVLEYELTEKGNYILRVFRRENYDVLNQSNVPQTGVGISFRKSFSGKSKSDKKKKDQEKQNDPNAILPNEQKKPKQKNE